MGLFHKTINDMEKAFNEGRVDDAHKILKKHLDDEHHFMADLSHLMRATAAFQQQLANMKGGWTDWIQSKEKFHQGIEQLRTQLTGIKYTIGKLVKEEKVKLE